MKFIKFIILLFMGAFIVKQSTAQDIAVNLATPNSGNVNVGATILLQVDVSNTDPTGNLPANRARVQITVPAGGITTILASGHNLFPGWTIETQTSTSIRIRSTTSAIPAATTQTSYIAIQGGTVGSVIVQGQLSFPLGAPTTPPDNTANNSSTAPIVVSAATCNITGATSVPGTPIACNGGTTTLTVNAVTSGATGTLEYSLNGGAFQASNVFTVNAAGSPYTAVVREVANISCNATAAAVTVTQPTAITASASAPAILCNGGTTTLTVNASGGTGALEYSLNGGAFQSGNTFTVNAAGSPYVVTVRDANSCTVNSNSVTVSEPTAISASASAGSILCNAGTTTLTVSASGGTGAYQYSLNGGAYQAGNTFTVNAAGSPYVVTVRDVNNCTVNTNSVSLSQPGAVVASASVTTPIAISGGTGVITVSASGGTGTKTYVITSGTTVNTTGATSGVFTGLLAGNYTFTATDANGCTGSVSILLANPGIATADPAVGQMYFTTTTGSVQDANNLLLAPSSALYDINVPFYNLNQVNEVPNGTIQLKINLGRKLDVAPGFALASAPLNSYFSWAQSVEGPGNVVITGTQLATIPADFDGLLVFRVKGDSACRSNVVSNVIITNQLQTLSDDDTQNNTSTLQYNLPVTLSKTQVNVTCNGASNGILNITASSGTSVQTTGPGGYTNTTGLASGSNNFTLSGLAPGVYTITATAPSEATLASCSQVITSTIIQPAVLTINNSGSVNNTCFGGNAGSITVVAAGGTSPYTYTIAGPTVNSTGALSGVFTGLAAGSYVVTVTDNNGCTASTPAIVITQPVGGIPDITLGSDITGSLFASSGATQTIVYNIAEIAGNAAVGDTIRITKVAGFTITFNPTLFSTVVGSTTYTLDNTRWKIDNTNPAFVSIILTDPANASNPGTLLCNQLVRVAVSITRNTTNISTFTLSARLRRSNGELNLNNNLNSIILTAD